MPGRLGVLGGMGPAATVRFLSLLVELTPATADQDHIPMLVTFAPAVPDRSSAIAGRGESPLSALLFEIERLNRATVDVVCIPCNSAHHRIPQRSSKDLCVGEVFSLIRVMIGNKG